MSERKYISGKAPCLKCKENCISQSGYCKTCRMKECKSCKRKFEPFKGRTTCNECFKKTNKGDSYGIVSSYIEFGLDSLHSTT
jgi:hypothetical protein